MARKGKQAQAQAQAQEETIVVTHHVKEWQPTHDDSLPKIHKAIDSWGHEGSSSARATSTLMASARDLDHDEVAAKVDKITKRVKGTQKVTVTETVTEWVEGPMGSGPVAVEEEAQEPPKVVQEEAWSAKDGAKATGKPAKEKGGLFGFLGRKKDGDKKDGDKKDGDKKAGDKKAGKADPDYQPQCMALTEDGKQCRNSARGESKYCSSHKGYQPPTAKGLAQRIEGDAWDPDDHVTDHQSVRSKDTRPKVAKAKDTRLRTRKARKKGGKKKR